MAHRLTNEDQGYPDKEQCKGDGKLQRRTGAEWRIPVPGNGEEEITHAANAERESKTVQYAPDLPNDWRSDAGL